MFKKHYSGPQIAAKLRQADVLIGKGKTVPEVCKEIENTVVLTVLYIPAIRSTFWLVTSCVFSSMSGNSSY
jgi:hypothetical protein